MLWSMTACITGEDACGLGLGPPTGPLDCGVQGGSRDMEDTCPCCIPFKCVGAGNHWLRKRGIRSPERRQKYSNTPVRKLGGSM